MKQILGWDAKAQPYEVIEDIMAALNHSAFNCYVIMIDDTGGDDYAIVLSDEPMTQEMAEKYYLDSLNAPT